MDKLWKDLSLENNEILNQVPEKGKNLYTLMEELPRCFYQPRL